MATFADLAEQAGLLMDRARRRSRALSPPQAMDLARELAAGIRAGIRILDDVRDAQPPDSPTPIAPGLERARLLATAARRHLSRIASPPDDAELEAEHDTAAAPPPQSKPASGVVVGPVPQIHAAVRAMGAAEQVLQSYFTAPAVSRPREPKREAYTVIANPATSHQLIAAAGEWCTKVGATAATAAAGLRVTGAWSGTGQGPSIRKHLVAAETSLAAAVRNLPARHSPSRVGHQSSRLAQIGIASAPGPTPEPSTPAGWLAATLAELDKLAATGSAQWTASAQMPALRVTAGAAASICAHASILAQQLAARAEDLLPEPAAVAADLLDTSHALAIASDAWHRAIRPAAPAGDSQGLDATTTVLTAPALNAAAAMGRAVTNHDHWAPGHPPAPAREPAAFAAARHELAGAIATTSRICARLATLTGHPHSPDGTSTATPRTSKPRTDSHELATLRQDCAIASQLTKQAETMLRPVQHPASTFSAETAPTSQEPASRQPPVRRNDHALSVRDAAITRLQISPGLHLTQIAALDVGDLDVGDPALPADIATIRVRDRESGPRHTVAADRSTQLALLAWLNVRPTRRGADHTSALFLSTRGRRLTVRAIRGIGTEPGDGAEQLSEPLQTLLLGYYTTIASTEPAGRPNMEPRIARCPLPHLGEPVARRKPNRDYRRRPPH